MSWAAVWVQNVKFRDVWTFVGMKGIKGFGEIEQVTVNLPLLSVIGMLYGPSMLIHPAHWLSLGCGIYIRHC